MAGVTVATSIAPAFADTQELKVQEYNKIYTGDSKNIDSLLDGVTNLLGKKYTQNEQLFPTEGREPGNVYSIYSGATLDDINQQILHMQGSMQKNDHGVSEVVPASTLGTEKVTSVSIKNQIDALNEGDTLNVVVLDKGHKTVDGKTVDYKYEQFKTAAEIKELAEANGKIAKVVSNNDVEVRTNPGDKPVVISTGDYIVDFTKPVINEFNEVIGYKKKPFDIKSVVTNVITIEKTSATRSELKASDLFDGLRLTEKGTSLTAKLTNAKENDKEIEFKNANFLVTNPSFAEKPSFEIQIKNKLTGKIEEIIKISDEDASLVRNLYQVISGTDLGYLQVSNISGDDRFKTAIEVSKNTFKAQNPKNADEFANAVVLVGKDSVVDGLAASPLAFSKKAPILLTDKNGLNKETEKELLRVLSNDLKNKTIYIIGGENQFSKEAENGLSRLGVKNIKRISGNDRYETSLAISRELNSSSNKAFVVGGYGEADAMSIAAYASSQESPIIVTDKNNLSKEAIKQLNGKEIEIVGGQNSVSNEVQTLLSKLDSDKNATRISGRDRQETNAQVINKYYRTSKKVYMAKDGYRKQSDLIDALSVAPLAAKEDSPIVLATSDISSAQKDSIVLRLRKTIKSIVQVGHGMADKAITNLIDGIKYPNL